MMSRYVLMGASLLAASTVAMADVGPVAGPWDARFVAGGIGIERELPADSRLLGADADWSITGWIRLDEGSAGTIVSMGGGQRVLDVRTDGRLVLSAGGVASVSQKPLSAGRWSHVAIVRSKGRIAFYIDGQPAGSGKSAAVAVDRRIAFAPVSAGRPHLSATVVGFGVDDTALAAPAIAWAAASPPDFGAAHVWEVGRGWEWQFKANTGYWRPQDPWTLPRSRTGFDKPVATPPAALPALSSRSAGLWQINGWTLAAAPSVSEPGAQLSRPGSPTTGTWYPANVPGTVLGTLVDRGVYPDPYRGLNNMAIPESLARQDYWYRTEFDMPAEAAGKQAELIVNGANYAGEIWINGKPAGGMLGAFIRGKFRFDPVAGRNAVAIRVSPPPHPGTPHEESISAGPGENGGQLAIDGPTFVATEGWDWIPGIRDRNTGLWQPVELKVTGPLEIGDPDIVTDLPLPRTDSADIYVTVPVRNLGATPLDATVTLAFDGIEIRRTERIGAGESRELRFTPSTDPALRVANPTLWWPNGYGEPALHTMRIAASGPAGPSDQRSLRFGIREVSYDLALMSKAGKLARVNVQTTDGRLAGQQLIDVTHPNIWQTPTGYAASLTAAGEGSPAVTPVTDYAIPEPHLALRVNGVRIAARGGNWGMDDAMKRVSRARLEPYFRLHREAGVNIIRNWMGTNTEPEFFELADENGLMILNDFWQSTQNFQVEPQDPQLFLTNARDTIARYRTHPSIVLWFGRNEGVPYPMLNEGLDRAVFELDGTRWFTGSSNTVNLQYSGPYNYRPPVQYFTDLATGFSVESGTPSLATRESIEASVPPADRWPISDTLAYHDWHIGGNGDVKTFMETLDRRFGAGTSLADFERKAQMMNLESYKAIFEGMQAHLWTRNTGRMLWMTHPAWPSNHWQIYSSDYDTHGSYYGFKSAAEPLHVQLNLPDNAVTVVNTTRGAEQGLTAETRVIGLDGGELWRRSDMLDAPANDIVTLPAVPLASLFAAHQTVLVQQTLRRRDGTVASRNFYWRSADDAGLRALNRLTPVDLTATVAPAPARPNHHALSVTLRNASTTPALAAKLTLTDDQGTRILPAYYAENYISLLPGEERSVIIEWPDIAPNGSRTPTHGRIALRGWNVSEKVVE